MIRAEPETDVPVPKPAPPFAAGSSFAVSPDVRLEHAPRTSDASRPIAVIKLGGSALAHPTALAELQQMVKRELGGHRIVVVHGGSPEISSLFAMAGLDTRVLDGMRVTTFSGSELVATALCGMVAPRVVRALDRAGVRAVAVSGLDAGLLRARYLDAAKFGQVGAAPNVDPVLLRGLLDEGFLPVVAPVALGPDGEIMNVNGDFAAAAIARALGAERLDLVTTGPLRNARGEPIALVPAKRVRSLVDDGTATAGMIPKITAAQIALEPRDAASRGRPVGVARVGGFAEFASGRATRIESGRCDSGAAECGPAEPAATDSGATEGCE